MCERCERLGDGGTVGSGRLRAWEFPDNAQCPLIGTCLNQDDLAKIARKLGLEIGTEAHDYDVHAYFVRRASHDCPESRAIHKLLDQRYAGALRRVGRARSVAELRVLWKEMKEAGRIAAAFYAFMTLRNVPLSFRAHVFGEVHMMSHLMGASFRSQSQKAAELQTRLGEAEARRERVEIGLRSALAERDARIASMETEILTLRADVARRSRKEPRPRDDHASAKARRAVETARARARAAEAEAALLKADIDEARRKLRRTLCGTATASGPAMRDEPEAVRLDGNAILFIGGRDRQISHLRRLAGEYGAVLVHHDGGLEDATTRIDEILPSVDCVFCPIDCVSHDACVRAKAGCRKLGKAFVPLRNASKASLRQGLMTLARQRTP